jgi:hypothetical protein
LGVWAFVLSGQGEKMRRVLILLVLASLVLASWGQASLIMLAWDRVPTADSYRLYYGMASGQYHTVLPTGPATTANVVGLAENTVYFFAATAVNAVGESGYSNEVSAIAAPLPPVDTIPPLVRILSPQDGGTVPKRSTVVVMVEATDNVGVTSVRLAVEELLLMCTGTGPYSCAWDVHPANRRSYTLQAVATDAANNHGVSPMVEVTSE